MLPRECEEEMQAGNLSACGTNSGDTRRAAGTNSRKDSALQASLNWKSSLVYKWQFQGEWTTSHLEGHHSDLE